MAKDGSVAPKERINIKYTPATGDMQEDVELPLKMLVIGDFKGHEEETPLEERPAISVNKDNFSEVMQKADLSMNFVVDDHLSEEENATINVNFDVNSLQDFTPDNLTKNVPELNKLLSLREALVALKGPLGNVPSFRKKLQDLLGDESARGTLASELEAVLAPKKDGEDKE
jgi:type VI secretion system protein ImpB